VSVRFWFDDDVDYLDHDFDYDVDDQLDDFEHVNVDLDGSEAVGAGVVSAFVVAAREACSASSVTPRWGCCVVGWCCDAACEGDEVAGCGWGADGCESDVFVCVAWGGAVGGSEFLY
jgi:hypothetical protein